jgi:hypothetical protein
MAIEYEKLRIRELVGKIKKLEAQNEQLDAITKEKNRKGKTSNRSYYGQYGN